MLQINCKTEQDILSEITDYLDAYQYSIRSNGCDYYLYLKERSAFPWSAPGKKRLFGGHPPSSVQYEPVVTAILDYFIDRCAVSTFFDIGAESGYFSWVASSRADRKITSHAFEMRPEACDRIRQMSARRADSDIHVHAAAVSDRFSGEKPIWFSMMKLFEHEPEAHEFKESFFTRLKFRLRGKLGVRSAIHRTEARVDTIDHFTEARRIIPDVIKIDVEGYEGKVVRGGLRTFAMHKPIVLLELHKSKHLKRTGMTRKDVVKPLYDAGYTGIFFETHHDLAGARPRFVTADDPVWARENTDFCVFF
ncbi:FkbM family methyltransferase [Roseibium sediminis]|uniref:FkbM family methyltransferase n=1 Tax=Roseibium sediminis TaxID=1775174 RepID=UPI00123E279B|nr:FkbM family methyltransferase [Roseibium sediminis]